MKILLGVTGGIAAYKTAVLIRELKTRGHEVKVIMTKAAKDFITPLTLATLSQNPVCTENFSAEDGRWNSHISIGEWAEAMIIAPATANTIAKMRAGIADNLLLCTYLSARCKVFIAPAMDLDMWTHSATIENIQTLKQRGVEIIEPNSGFLASGLEGKGRMAEPIEIAECVCDKNNQELKGKKIMITCGGTIEPIDSVRFISNHSSGKMGKALEIELKKKGAEVIVVRGGSAEDMLLNAQKSIKGCDIAIFAAAVTDYTVKEPAKNKIKSNNKNENLTLELIPTKDIARTIANENPEIFTVGFALEDKDEEKNAIKKLEQKGLNLIVLNSLNDTGAGFGTDTNKVTIYNNRGEKKKYPLKSKIEVAKDIINEIILELKK